LEKGQKPEKGRRTRELRFSAKTKVRVSLTYNYIKPVIHMIISKVGIVWRIWELG